MRYVVYHANCPDGFTGAWVFNKRYGSDGTEFIPMGHHKWNTLYDLELEDSEIYFVDCCPPRDLLKWARGKSDFCQVLDHHKSNISVAEGLDNVIMDMDRSGAAIAWDYCFPEQERPPIVDYVMDRDLWRWEIEDSEPILACLDQVAYEFDNWTNFNNKLKFDKQALITEGLVILSYQNKMIEYHKSRKHRILLGGYEVPAVNSSYVPINSRLANEISIGEAFGVAYSYNGSMWTLSLRSSGEPGSVDVSEVAEQFGGGGHAKASGMRCDKPVWVWVEKNE